MEKLTPFLGHLKKVRPLLTVSFFARSSITRARPQSGHSIKGSPDSLPVGYATACTRVELQPRSCLLPDLLALEDSALRDMATLAQGRREGSWRRRRGEQGRRSSAARGGRRRMRQKEVGGEGGSIRPDRVSGSGVNRAQRAVTGAERRRCLLTQRQRGPVSWLPHPQMW